MNYKYATHLYWAQETQVIKDLQCFPRHNFLKNYVHPTVLTPVGQTGES